MIPPSLWPALLPAAPRARPVRAAAALVLQGASRALGRLAQQLAAAPARPRLPAYELAFSNLEFHAEAGAPEGALYVDGRLVATLPGVKRL